MKLKSLLASLSLLFVVAAVPAGVDAQVDVFEGVCDGRGSNSAVCKDAEGGQKENPIFGPKGVMTRVINVVSIAVGIGAVIGIIFAGFKFITAGDNSQSVTEARNALLYAIIGLIVAASAQALVQVFLSKL